MSKLSAPHFHDEEAARVYLEALRWPSGPVCAHCGTVNKAYATKRPGKYRCATKECRKEFTVKVGRVFEASHIPLHKWLLAAYLLCSSKKGMSSHQLMRTLEVTYKTAWFMTHRIREAMRTGAFSPLGGSGQVIEADETYIGRKAGTVSRRGHGHKRAVVTLVERNGEARSFHVDRATIFSIFKRGFKGIHQHCGEDHLHRYLAEYDFRYNNRVRFGIGDERRMNIASPQAEGKRLTYRWIGGQA